jgi:hypothetical protein
VAFKGSTGWYTILRTIENMEMQEYNGEQVEVVLTEDGSIVKGTFSCQIGIDPYLTTVGGDVIKINPSDKIKYADE